jgi:hypothetical protein
MTFPDDSIYPKIEGTIDEKDGCSMVYDNKPLTKREYFAALAMRGFTAARGTHYTEVYLAYESVKVADALIEQLNKTNHEHQPKPNDGGA